MQEVGSQQQQWFGSLGFDGTVAKLIIEGQIIMMTVREVQWRMVRHA